MSDDVSVQTQDSDTVAAASSDGDSAIATDQTTASDAGDATTGDTSAPATAADPEADTQSGSTPEQDSWLHSTLGIDVSAYASQAYDAAANAVSDTADAVTDAASTAYDTATTAVADTANAVTDAASTAYDTATTAVADTANAVTDAASTAYDTATTAVSDTANAVTDAASTAYDTATTAVSDTANAVTDAASTAYDTASEVAGDVANFGSSVVNTVTNAAGDLADDLSNAASGVVAAAGSGAALADLTAGSGATGGGPPDAAGGGSKANLLARIKQMKALADDYDALGKDIEDNGHHWFHNDTDLIASGKAMRDVAKTIMDLTAALNGWAVKVDDSTITSGNDAVGAFGKLLTAADMVVALKGATIAVNQLKDKTNQQSVDAWADSITNTFDKASGLIGMIPDGVLPGFIKDYYQGLFSAPKNYVGYFRKVMKEHYDYIDSKGYVPSGDHLAVQGEKTMWEGALTGVYCGAFTLPKTAGDLTLENFMTAHRDEDGLDLYTALEQAGRAALTQRILKYVNDPVRDKWVAYVQG